MLVALRDDRLPSVFPLANDQGWRSRVLEEEACNASQAERGAPAPAVPGDHDEARAFLLDAPQELESDIVMGQDGSHTQPLVNHAVTEAREIALGHSGVAVDQTLFELQLFNVEGLGPRELGHWDDVDQEELRTVLASETGGQRQGTFGAW